MRQRLVDGHAQGIVATHGLLAHGRGEAFDYLLGERTTPAAARATEAAAAALVLAQRPVVSVNGNAAALVPSELVAMAAATRAQLEVNLFHRTEERVAAIIAHLRSHGATAVLGADPDDRIAGLDHARALCCSAGIGQADVVLVPLEDGDRTEALVRASKRVLTVDLNPLSRTALAAHITIVDNLVRAAPALVSAAASLSRDRSRAEEVLRSFDNASTLQEQVTLIRGGASSRVKA